MNATTRVITQELLALPALTWQRLSKQSLQTFALLTLVLACAFSVITIKNNHRELTSDIQSLQYQFHNLQVERNQLLLEQSAWAKEARIKQVAESRWQMKLPDAKHSVMILT